MHRMVQQLESDLQHRAHVRLHTEVGLQRNRVGLFSPITFRKGKFTAASKLLKSNTIFAIYDALTGTVCVKEEHLCLALFIFLFHFMRHCADSKDKGTVV